MDPVLRDRVAPQPHGARATTVCNPSKSVISRIGTHGGRVRGTCLHLRSPDCLGMETSATTSISPPEELNARQRADWWTAHPEALLERLRRQVLTHWVPVVLVEADGPDEAEAP